MQKPDELPIIRAWYEFLIWIVPKIEKFPRNLRFTLGERLEQRILAVLETLIRARYSRNRLNLLEAANTELDVILYLLRAAHDLKALPTRAYGMTSEKLLEIGVQLGGWKRASQPRCGTDHET
ncbi:MAG: diversity-generating retroelement protein Avd [Planctomycetes bacterium]|nr:diversity-generating retroelement protein Avd [Planctomycetota bacterium]